jgi:formate/nitrite transporter FocA (FNT family)
VLMQGTCRTKASAHLRVRPPAAPSFFLRAAAGGSFVDFGTCAAALAWSTGASAGSAGERVVMAFTFACGGRERDRPWHKV